MTVNPKDLLMLRKAGAKFGPQPEVEVPAETNQPSAIEGLLGELVETQKKILALGLNKIPAPNVDVNIEAPSAPNVTVSAPNVTVESPKTSAAIRAWNVEVTERDKNGRMKGIRITAG